MSDLNLQPETTETPAKSPKCCGGSVKRLGFTKEAKEGQRVLNWKFGVFSCRGNTCCFGLSNLAAILVSSMEELSSKLLNLFSGAITKFSPLWLYLANISNRFAGSVNYLPLWLLGSGN